MIIDNFSINNITSIESYDSGNVYVYNFLIYEDNVSDKGFNIFYYEGSITTKLWIDDIAYVFNVAMVDLPAAILANDTLVAAGIVAKIVTDFNSHSSAVLLICTGKATDYRRVTFELRVGYNTCVGTNVPPTDAVYDILYNAAYNETLFFILSPPSGPPFIPVFTNNHVVYFTLMPYGDNQIFYKSDSSSILTYGKRLYKLKNYSTLTDPYEIQAALSNKLAELKDPKARMVVHIPFNYQNVDILDTVEVRLKYQNVDQAWGFTEGGVYLSWEDHPDGYRYKQFLVTGIRHGQDGTYTSLNLMEKDIVEEEEEEEMVTGAITAYGGITAPSGYLMCDGSAVSRSIYAALYSVIGVSFGYGDDSTTFNVPDLRGRFLRGLDGGVARDPDSSTRTAMTTGGNTGDAVGSVQTESIGGHVHTMSDSYYNQNYDFGGTSGHYVAAAGTVANSEKTGNVDGVHTETRPINANVNYIIKT